MASNGTTRTGWGTAAALSTGMVGTALIMGVPAAFAGGTPPGSPVENSTTTSTTAPATTSTTPPPTTSTTTPAVTTTTTAPATSTTTTAPPASGGGPGGTVPAQPTVLPGVGVRASADTGSGKTITVSVDPKVIVANGVSTSTATALLAVDDNGATCDDGDAPCYFTQGDVTFSSSDPAEKVSATTNPTTSDPFTADPSQGAYTATITSSTKVEVATITATDTIGQVGAAARSIPAQPSVTTISASTSLTQVAGPATRITLALQPTSIVANGTSESEATATLTDSLGHQVSFDHVSFASSDSGEKIGPVTDHSNGTYTAFVTSSTKAATDVITATDSSVTPHISASADLVQTPGPAAHISLVVSPASIPADGKTTTTATATVTDAFGNLVSGNNVTFSSTDPNEKFGATSDGTGTYTTHITASSTAGTATITATDLSVTPNISATAPLTQTALAAKSAGANVLPFTGMSATEEAGLSAGLLAAGGGLVATVRRQRRPRFAHSIKRQ